MSAQSELARFERAQRRRTFDSEWFDGDDSPVRLYCKWDGSNPVGWVKSVKTPFGGNWVSDLYVAPGYRRQGLATALMTKMLVEDHRLGVEASVLLSSHAGAGLYPRLGYQRLGTLLLMRPPS
jgi:GNAT superfamily N-acetyltransferase